MREVNLPQEEKRRIRQETIARRDRLSAATRAAASRAIRSRLDELHAVTRARTLLGFASFGSEVQLDPLLRAAIDRGVGVFLPWIERFSPPDLQMSRVTDLDNDLVAARMGIREPDPQWRRPGRVDRLDVVLAPGVAFDAAGTRLGYGAGFYDRLLARLRPDTPVIAVAYDTQIVEALPRLDHDVPVDAIVTQTRTIDVTRRATTGDL
ncbi:MAG: 5-formyltetrahydrofolate cyclo-ligase [Actinobacteria bacterium]|nr:5-formyltetrahydrofolate cyclo-ligase [Actinomycetota bacterium]